MTNEGIERQTEVVTEQLMVKQLGSMALEMIRMQAELSVLRGVTAAKAEPDKAEKPAAKGSKN